ncbi:hypothetical protein A2U01_0075272, partial [Trifolium medium]|nr:hypothetical protein [Trifolium medium]
KAIIAAQVKEDLEFLADLNSRFPYPTPISVKDGEEFVAEWESRRQTNIGDVESGKKKGKKKGSS